MDGVIDSLLHAPETEPDRTKADTIVSDRDGILEGELQDGTDVDDFYRNIRTERDGVWRTDGEALGVVEAGNTGLEDVEFDYVEAVKAGRDGVIDADIDSMRYLHAGSTAATDSTIGEVRLLESEEDGLKDSRADSITRLMTEGDGLARSIVGEIEHLYSGNNAVTEDSIVEQAGTIQAEGNAITHADAGEVGNIEAEGYGIAGDAEVQDVKELRASTGVIHGRANRIGRLEATDSALIDATVGEIEYLTTDRRMAERSDIEEIGTAEADFYESEDEIETLGFKDCDIGSIEALKVAKFALEDSEVEEVGKLEAVWNGIIRSTVDTVAGDITVENYPIYSSVIGEVHGDIETDLDAVVDSTVDAIYGDVLAGKALFKDSELGLTASDSITAKQLSDASYGNLIVADTIRTDATGPGTTVITADDDRFTDYRGDIDELKGALKDDHERLWPLQVFQPDIGEATSLEELDTMANELEPLLDGLSRDDVQNSYRDVISYSFLEPAYFGQILSSYTDEFENVRMESVQEFGTYLEDMDAEARERLIDLLETHDRDVGQDIYSIARGEHFLDSVKEPVATLEDLATTETDVTYELDEMLLDSPYQDAFEETLDAEQDRLEDALAMAEEAGVTMTMDLERRLKQWEGQRRAGHGERSIDSDELQKELRKELDDKTRAYTLEALRELGKDEADRRYRDIFGGEGLDDDTDAAALELHEAYIFNREALEAVMDGSVYETERNRSWIEEQDIDEELLTEGPGERTYDLSHSEWEDGEFLTAEGEYTARVASPEETLRMGDYFPDSCFATDKLRGWHAAGTAADINKQVVYLENENGSIVGRQMVAVTEDGGLSTFTPYTNTDDPVEEAMDRYIDEWADEMGLDRVEQEKSVELLETERWHDRAI